MSNRTMKRFAFALLALCTTLFCRAEVTLGCFAHHFDIPLAETVTAKLGEATLANFPLPVKLASNFAYSDFQHEGLDICFVDESGTFLPFELDTYNPAGESLYWVKVPTLSKNTVLTCYYGAAQATENTPTDVWSSYVAVIHGGTTLKNSAGSLAVSFASVSSTTPATTYSTATSAADLFLGGGVQTCAELNGVYTKGVGVWVNNPVTAGVLEANYQLTVTGWFKREAFRSSTSPTLFFTDTPSNYDNGSMIFLSEKNAWLSVADGHYKTSQASGGHQPTKLTGGYAASEYQKGVPRTNEWCHIGFTYDKTTPTTSGDVVTGGKLCTYSGGELIYSSDDAYANESPSATYWTFGSYPTSNGDSFPGKMDELRLYKGIASDLWMACECLSAQTAAVFDPANIPVVDIVTLGTPTLRQEVQVDVDGYRASITGVSGVGQVYLLWGPAADFDTSAELTLETIPASASQQLLTVGDEDVSGKTYSYRMTTPLSTECAYAFLAVGTNGTCRTSYGSDTFTLSAVTDIYYRPEELITENIEVKGTNIVEILKGHGMMSLRVISAVGRGNIEDKVMLPYFVEVDSANQTVSIDFQYGEDATWIKCLQVILSVRDGKNYLQPVMAYYYSKKTWGGAGVLSHKDTGKKDFTTNNNLIYSSSTPNGYGIKQITLASHKDYTRTTTLPPGATVHVDENVDLAVSGVATADEVDNPFVINSGTVTFSATNAFTLASPVSGSESTLTISGHGPETEDTGSPESQEEVTSSYFTKDYKIMFAQTTLADLGIVPFKTDWATNHIGLITEPQMCGNTQYIGNFYYLEVAEDGKSMTVEVQKAQGDNNVKSVKIELKEVAGNIFGRALKAAYYVKNNTTIFEGSFSIDNPDDAAYILAGTLNVDGGATPSGYGVKYLKATLDNTLEEVTVETMANSYPQISQNLPFLIARNHRLEDLMDLSVADLTGIDMSKMEDAVLLCDEWEAGCREYEYQVKLTTGKINVVSFHVFQTAENEIWGYETRGSIFDADSIPFGLWATGRTAESENLVIKINKLYVRFRKSVTVSPLQVTGENTMKNGTLAIAEDTIARIVVPAAVPSDGTVTVGRNAQVVFDRQPPTEYSVPKPFTLTAEPGSAITVKGILFGGNKCKPVTLDNSVLHLMNRHEQTWEYGDYLDEVELKNGASIHGRAYRVRNDDVLRVRGTGSCYNDAGVILCMNTAAPGTYTLDVANTTGDPEVDLEMTGMLGPYDYRYEGGTLRKIGAGTFRQKMFYTSQTLKIAHLLEEGTWILAGDAMLNSACNSFTQLGGTLEVEAGVTDNKMSAYTLEGDSLLVLNEYSELSLGSVASATWTAGAKLLVTMPQSAKLMATTLTEEQRAAITINGLPAIYENGYLTDGTNGKLTDTGFIFTVRGLNAGMAAVYPTALSEDYENADETTTWKGDCTFVGESAFTTDADLLTCGRPIAYTDAPNPNHYLGFKGYAARAPVTTTGRLNYDMLVKAPRSVLPDGGTNINNTISFANLPTDVANCRFAIALAKDAEDEASPQRFYRFVRTSPTAGEWVALVNQTNATLALAEGAWARLTVSILAGAKRYLVRLNGDFYGEFDCLVDASSFDAFVEEIHGGASIDDFVTNPGEPKPRIVTDLGLIPLDTGFYRAARFDASQYDWMQIGKDEEERAYETYYGVNYQRLDKKRTGELDPEIVRPTVPAMDMALEAGEPIVKFTVAAPKSRLYYCVQVLTDRTNVVDVSSVKQFYAGKEAPETLTISAPMWPVTDKPAPKVIYYKVTVSDGL